MASPWATSATCVANSSATCAMRGARPTSEYIFCSHWWQIEPGDNNVQYNASGTTTNSSMVVRWQDAWV